jgi:hypothetical protein
MEIDDISIDDIKLPGEKTALADVTQEVKDIEASKIDSKVDESTANKDIHKAPDAEVSEPGEGAAPSEEGDDQPLSQLLGRFSQESGIAIESEEDVVSALKELAVMRGGKKVSPALQKAIEIEEKGGNLSAYFRQLATNPDTLEPREALWSVFASTKGDLVEKNPRLAKMDFEREFNSKFSKLIEFSRLKDETEKDDFFKENKEQIEYEKERYDYEVAAAREAIRKQQESASFFEQGSQMSEEELAQLERTHQTSVTSILNEFESVAVPIGNEEFSLGISEKSRPMVEKFMRSPDLFLKEIGFADGAIDYDKLAGAVTLFASLTSGELGERLQKYVIDSKDISTLEGGINAPGIKRSNGSAPSGDIWDQVAQAAVKARGGV